MENISWAQITFPLGGGSEQVGELRSFMAGLVASGYQVRATLSRPRRLANSSPYSSTGVRGPARTFRADLTACPLQIHAKLLLAAHYGAPS